MKERELITSFMRALVQFAWCELSKFPSPSGALTKFFAPFVVRTDRIAEVWPGVIYVDFEEPQIHGREMTMEQLASIQGDIRSDLQSLAEATTVWHVATWKRRTTLKAGRSQKKPFRPYVKVPAEVLRHLCQHIPRFTLDEEGELLPVEADDTDDVLHYGLILSIQEGVLLRCGLCTNCRRLVVHERQPTTPRARHFCRDGGRDCKTEFHNARKLKRGQQSSRKKKPRRHSPRPDHVSGAKVLSAFLRACKNRPHDQEITDLVRRIGGSGATGWALIRKMSKELASETALTRYWNGLPEPARRALQQWFRTTTREGATS